MRHGYQADSGEIDMGPIADRTAMELRSVGILGRKPDLGCEAGL